MGRATRTGIAVAAVAVLGLGATACSSDEASDDETTTTDEETTSTTVAETTTTRPPVVNSGGSIEIVDFDYLPGDITVTAGQTITWTNTADNRHTVTSDDGRFESSTPMRQDQQYIQAFPEAGTFLYYCTFHPEDMQGTITVM